MPRLLWAARSFPQSLCPPFFSILCCARASAVPCLHLSCALLALLFAVFHPSFGILLCILFPLVVLGEFQDRMLARLGEFQDGMLAGLGEL
jgi:hypothetical protein